MKGQSWRKRGEEKLVQKLQNLVDLCDLGSQAIQTCCDRHVPAQWCALNQFSSHRDTGMVARSCWSLPHLVVCLWAWPSAQGQGRQSMVLWRALPASHSLHRPQSTDKIKLLVFPCSCFFQTVSSWKWHISDCLIRVLFLREDTGDFA